MYFKKIIDMNGNWMDKNDIRYLILESLSISEEETGWEDYENIYEYAQAYQLSQSSIEHRIESNVQIQIENLRIKYRECTQQLCSLAGVEMKYKLEDIEYEQVTIKALGANPVLSMFLTQTIMYCFFQLKILDGDNAWDKI
jgi:NADH:ubiquinone oxidoreductase subunit E